MSADKSVRIIMVNEGETKGVYVDASEGLSYLEALGMMEIARAEIFEQMKNRKALSQYGVTET